MQIVRNIQLEPIGDSEADWKSDGTFSTAIPDLPDDLAPFEPFEPAGTNVRAADRNRRLRELIDKAVALG